MGGKRTLLDIIPNKAHAGAYGITAVSPKQKFNLLLEPRQIAALEAIEEKTGARLSEQIRRAIDAYLEAQTVIPKRELRTILER